MEQENKLENLIETLSPYEKIIPMRTSPEIIQQIERQPKLMSEMASGVCILGDVMLDHYEYVQPVRISPEAPVMIVRYKSDYYVPGGAANVAANCLALGTKPYLVGAIGRDAIGSLLCKTLTDRNIDIDYLIQSSSFVTIEKRRVTNENNQQLLRIDYELVDQMFSLDQVNEMYRVASDLSQVCSTLVISDYNKGIAKVAEKVIELFRSKGKFVVVNAKPENIDKYQYANLIVLNEEEYLRAGQLGFIIKPEHVITCGGNGMWYHKSSGETIHIPAVKVDVADVSGAGDTVVASIAVKGKVDELVLEMAALNAATVVSKHGTATP